MAERSFDNFDEFSTDYRDIHNENISMSGADSLYFAEMKVKYMKDFEENKPLKVLDIGCGDGAVERFMKIIFPKWQISGIDISKNSIDEAKKNISGVEFKVYDGLTIPFESETFDVVFIACVLHHVEFKLHSELMNEINRVMKTNGRIYLFEHNPLNPVTRHIVNTCPFDKDAKLLSNWYASRLFNSNNYKQIRKDFIIFFPRKGLLSKFIFLEKFLKWLPLGGQYTIVSKKSV